MCLTAHFLSFNFSMYRLLIDVVHLNNGCHTTDILDELFEDLTEDYEIDESLRCKYFYYYNNAFLLIVFIVFNFEV